MDLPGFVGHRRQMQAPAPHPNRDFEAAIAHFEAGRYGAAEELCLRVLAAEPAQPHALHMLAILRAEQGKTEEGLALLQRALATGVVHPAIQQMHGNLLMRLDRNAEAAEPLRRSLRIDPDQPRVMQLLGVALTRTGQHAEAERVLKQASAIWPGDPRLLDALGAAYMSAGRYAEACSPLERALAVGADFPEAWGNLAVVYEQSNRLDEAARLALQGLARWPEHGTLNLIVARLARHAGDYAGARARLQSLQAKSGLLPALRRDIEFELGWCADGLGDVDAAFRHFSAAKLQAEALAAPSAELHQIYPRQLQALMRLYDGEATPVAPSPTELEDLPAFLLGFPRSGTTLLDTMLDAHGGFTVLEEQPSIQAMLDAYLAAGLSYPMDLPRIEQGTERRLREVYFRVCQEAGWDGNRPLVDKSPFAATHAGLLQRIFPGAPLVFLARHPCDVVLSCFMNNFEFNSGTVHFTRLDSTVRLYCDAMALWLRYRERLPLNHIMLRYEDLVTEPEAELRRLLEFLGASWSPSVLDHATQALRRGRIPTPSYQQVSRPLYQSARDRWRRYAAYLEPHLPALMPYILAFGYAA